MILTTHSALCRCPICTRNSSCSKSLLRTRQYVRLRCYLNDGTSFPHPPTQATFMDVKPMKKTRQQWGKIYTFVIYKVMGRSTSSSGCRSGTDHGTPTCARHTNCQRVMLCYIARLTHLMHHHIHALNALKCRLSWSFTLLNTVSLYF